ncbi:hypothetical protein BU15DRAFT_71911 [Melanogaster broomeanus]|nr:hypothetical protein BU15DRAFT_71911 [Melanogaster broomeanus]
MPGIRRTATSSEHPETDTDADDPMAYHEPNRFKSVLGSLLPKRAGRPALAELGTTKPAHLRSLIPRGLKEEVRNIKGLFGRTDGSSANGPRTWSPRASRSAGTRNRTSRALNQRVGIEPQISQDVPIEINGHLLDAQPSEDSMIVDDVAWSHPSYYQGHPQPDQRNESPAAFPVISIDVNSASSVAQPPPRQDSMQSVEMSSPPFPTRQMSIHENPAPPQVYPCPRDPERTLSLLQQADQFLKDLIGESKDLPAVPHQEIDLRSSDPLGSLDSSQPMAGVPPLSKTLAKPRFPSGRKLMGKIRGLGSIRSLLSRSNEPTSSHNASTMMAKPYTRPVESSSSRLPFLSRKRKLTLDPLDSYERQRLWRRQDSGPSSLLFAPPSPKEHSPPDETIDLSHPGPSNGTSRPKTIMHILHPDESFPKDGQRQTRRRQRSLSSEADDERDNRKTDRKKKRVRLDSRPSPVAGPSSQADATTTTPEHQLSLIEDLSLPLPFEEQPRQAKQPRSSKMKGHERRRAAAAAAAGMYTKAAKVHRNDRNGRLRASSEPPRSSLQPTELVDNGIRAPAVKPRRLAPRALPPTPQLPTISLDPSLEGSFGLSDDSASIRPPIRRRAGDDGPRRESSDEVEFYLGGASDLSGFPGPGIDERQPPGGFGSFASMWDALRDMEVRKKKAN